MTSKHTHTLTPAAALQAWLESNAETTAGRARFRLPVAVLFQDERRWSVGQAFIAGALDDDTSQRVALELDDGGLGIALIDTLRHRCADGTRGCVMWLEGLWGPLVSGLPVFESPDASAHIPVFAVLEVGDLVGEDDELVASIVD